jgi:hypothetical protein
VSFAIPHVVVLYRSPTSTRAGQKRDRVIAVIVQCACLPKTLLAEKCAPEKSEFIFQNYGGKTNIIGSESRSLFVKAIPLLSGLARLLISVLLSRRIKQQF